MSEDKKKKKVAHDLGGIFGVTSSGKKKKKKKVKAEESSAIDAISEAISEAVGEDSDASSERSTGSAPLDEPKKKKKKKKDKSKKKDKEKKKKKKDASATKKLTKKPKTNTGLEGVLLPGGPKIDAAEYLSDADLGDIEVPKNNTSLFLTIGIILLLVAILGGIVVALGKGDDLVSVFKGNLKEKKLAEKKMIEEEFEKDQKAKLHKFGNMMISGHPKYSEIKLNGKKHFGQVGSGAWREVRISTIAGIQDLGIRKDYNIEITSPGFEARKDKITEAMWTSGMGKTFGYPYNASLAPISEITKIEFDARLSQDSENEFFGKVTINSTPAGAKIRFNAQPLLNEKGEALKTPATFSKFYVTDKKTGKLVGNEIRVDSTIDRGHKIELEIEYPNSCPDTAPACGVEDGCCPKECTVATDNDCKYPKIVEALNREMWTCNWKDGVAPKEIAKDKSIQHYCDYSFSYNFDIAGLKTYIIERHQERETIKAESQAFKEEQKKKRLEKHKK